MAHKYLHFVFVKVGGEKQIYRAIKYHFILSLGSADVSFRELVFVIPMNCIADKMMYCAVYVQTSHRLFKTFRPDTEPVCWFILCS